MLENLTFGITAFLSALMEPRPDALIIETWPIIAAQLALAAAWIRRAPSIYYIKDVYPEAAEELGVIRKGGFLARSLRLWDGFICRRSSRVVVISESMRELILTRGLNSDHVSVIPDWIDADQFPVRPQDNPWRRKAGIPESRFVALFAGTIGLVSGADILVGVAEILMCHARPLLLCVGEGVLQKAIAEEIARRGLPNLRLEPFQPPEALADMHGGADALLLTMRDNPSDSSVPSKLISYLAAGRPVICSANSGSAVAGIVRKAGAGIVVPPGDARGIADAILLLSHSPAAAKQMGANARKYFEEHFTLGRAFRQFSELFAALLGPLDTNWNGVTAAEGEAQREAAHGSR